MIFFRLFWVARVFVADFALLQGYYLKILCRNHTFSCLLANVSCLSRNAIRQGVIKRCVSDLKTTGDQVDFGVVQISAIFS